MSEILDLEPAPARVLTAMITPFHDDGRLNHKAAQQLAEYLVGHGSDGLVLAGTTGESPTLRPRDHLDLFDVVREAVGSEVLLLGGTGSNNTEEAVELTREASSDARGSVDGFLVVSPYYNKPSQFGILDYYTQVAGATDKPITLYNIPGRTGKLVELDTIKRLAEAGMIAGVKDATGNTDMAEVLHQQFGADLAIYSGDDSLNLAFARVGAVGGISVASGWAGVLMGRMFDAHSSGDSERAELIQEALMPSAEFESVHTDASGQLRDTPNPIPANVITQHILPTVAIGECRPPMIASPEDMAYLKERAVQILADLQIAEASFA